MHFHYDASGVTRVADGGDLRARVCERKVASGLRGRLFRQESAEIKDASSPFIIILNSFPVASTGVKTHNSEKKGTTEKMLLVLHYILSYHWRQSKTK